MMKNMMKSACAIAVLAASTNVMADSVDLVVKGTIAPIACQANILGSGVFDYGVISPSSLKADTINNLPAKTSNITITCDAPTKIALKAANNRGGTIPGRELNLTYDEPTPGAKLFGSTTYPTLGLGMANGKKLGGWGVKFLNMKADNVVSDVIGTSDAGSTWVKDAAMRPTSTGRLLTSMAKTGELTPMTAKVFSYDIQVEAYINKTAELDVSKPAALDGSATIELVYL